MRWFFAALLLLGAVGIAASGPASAENRIVDIENTAYDPQQVEVFAGEYVAWCNYDDVAHTATFDGEDAPDIAVPVAESDDDPCPALTFNVAPGVYPYHCKIHDVPAMKGSVTVKQVTTTTTVATIPPTTVAGATTTAKPTPTTRRTTTTRRGFKATAVTRGSSTTSTLVAESTTTTNFFETTTSEFTTTTFGSFAINESDDGGNGGTVVAILLGLGVLGGAGYLGYRNRYRFMR